VGSGELESSQQEGKEQKKRIDGEKPEESGEKPEKSGARLDGGESEVGGKANDERISELERDIKEMRDSAASQAKRLRETEDKLKRTEELLAARSAELSGTQTFLSTKDRLSEAEVLDIVRDLNQNIYQVAVKLTEEWETLEPRATSQRDANPNSRHSRTPALVRLVRNQDSGSLTFLLQSRLCYQAEHITSSRSRHRELATIQSVYGRLSASGEGRIVDIKQHVTHTS